MRVGCKFANISELSQSGKENPSDHGGHGDQNSVLSKVIRTISKQTYLRLVTLMHHKLTSLQCWKHNYLAKPG